MNMRIAILALQGAFIEHKRRLESIGIDTFYVRNAEDWQKHKDALVIPGGESTAMWRMIKDFNMERPICDEIKAGMPVFGTCAGMILLDSAHLQTMNIEAERNAYGRQLGSFRTSGAFQGISHDVPMTFIRAPYIKKAGEKVRILARVDGRAVAAQQGNQLVTAFHPELDEDSAIHLYFKDIVLEWVKNNSRQRIL